MIFHVEIVHQSFKKNTKQFEFLNGKSDFKTFGKLHVAFFNANKKILIVQKAVQKISISVSIKGKRSKMIKLYFQHCFYFAEMQELKKVWPNNRFYM